MPSCGVNAPADEEGGSGGTDGGAGAKAAVRNAEAGRSTSATKVASHEEEEAVVQPINCGPRAQPQVRGTPPAANSIDEIEGVACNTPEEEDGTGAPSCDEEVSSMKKASGVW